MPPLPAIVRHTCRRWRMVSPGDKVLIAVSGGADSVALFEVLRELAPEMGLDLAVAHLDHGIRGQAGAADAVFVAGLASQAGLPFHRGDADVPSLARAGGRSLEDAAREARYAFLRAAAVEHGYDKIALGHTLDDQAETVLLAMVRGSGMGGLAAMRPAAGNLVRPLIEARRDDVVAYLRGLGQSYRIDETNCDLAYARNRVRQRLLPLLASEFNPGIVETLARQAEILRADEELLGALAAGLLRRAAHRSEGRVALDLRLLNGVPQALQRRIVRAAAAELYGGGALPLSFANVEDVLGLLVARTGSRIDLPGSCTAWREYHQLVFLRQARQAGGASPSARARQTKAGVFVRPLQARDAAVPVQVPGPVTVAERGWALSFELREARAQDRGDGRRWSVEPGKAGCRFRAVLDWDKLKEPLTVRPRAPGDRFRPLGAPGERKLQDFLTDAKVPRADRDRLPLLVDGSGAIAAVLPLRAAEWARVSDATRRLLVIEGRLAGLCVVADKGESW
ncbi:MAG: tRNA lysidine(34) synthetase TilS [Bacillota bacterium]|nr:tRNA lysidine(34) synthetase TilS [Bacillota bacterium]